jgi:hypothetical protein
MLTHEAMRGALCHSAEEFVQQKKTGIELLELARILDVRPVRVISAIRCCPLFSPTIISVAQELMSSRMDPAIPMRLFVPADVIAYRHPNMTVQG